MKFVHVGLVRHRQTKFDMQREGPVAECRVSRSEGGIAAVRRRETSGRCRPKVAVQPQIFRAVRRLSAGDKIRGDPNQCRISKAYHNSGTPTRTTLDRQIVVKGKTT